jgi:hypothetical protein
MKKAKIALSIIAILAVIGGAFAFKTSRGNVFYYGTTKTYCHYTIVAETTNNPTVPISFYTTSSTGVHNCTTARLTAEAL